MMVEKFGIYLTFEELAILKKILRDPSYCTMLPDKEFYAWKSATKKIVDELNFVLKTREGLLFKTTKSAAENERLSDRVLRRVRGEE